MPRLIDDLRATAKIGMPWFVEPSKETLWVDYAKRVLELVHDRTLPVLLIDNVAEYLYAGTDQEYWALDKDFPNIAPPFPMFWCEYKMVRTIHSKTEGDTDVSKWLPQGGRVGLLFTAVSREDAQGQGIPDDAHWIYWCDMFTDYNKPKVTADGPQGATFLCVDAQGRAVSKPWMQTYCSEANAELMKHTMSWYNPVWLAISFLHCKNVQIIENAIDKPLAKKWAAKHGGLQPTSYKTLVIEPLKAILRNEGRAHEHGLQKAMHICRGHFADYTQGRGLFGKYHGKYWMPSTVRGTKGKAAARVMEVKV